MEDTKVINIEEKYADPCINIALDTIARNKQAIFFVNTKSSAEKLSEEISKKIKNITLNELSEKIGNILAHPTQQCKRLQKIVHHGAAFHHAGLTPKQRELVEENFKSGNIKIICSTPTLAVGVDMPAFRAVVRDLKRYGGRWGMQDIPVLEYQQMAGRAGRPSFDAWGEAITVAKSETDKEDIFFKYINAENEDIYSKLAVEPVLRTYLLSLISSRYVKTRKEIVKFFSKTFWAYQYKDMEKLEMIIDRMLELLEEWEFVISIDKNLENKEIENEKIEKENLDADCLVDGFISAEKLLENNTFDSKNIKYRATELGQRVAELYLDPYTANQLIVAMNKSLNININLFSILHMISNTLEIRPLLNIRVRDDAMINEALAVYEDNFLIEEPSSFDFEHDEFMKTIKTALFMNDWCNEMDEQFLLDKYAIRPGEIRVKLDRADWLIYSCVELSKILSLNDLNRFLLKARFRLKNGVREELLPLLKLKGIGRVRGRKMFDNGLRTLGDLKKIDISSLVTIIGKATARSVKEQLDEKVPENMKVSDKKRIGQMSLGKYS